MLMFNSVELICIVSLFITNLLLYLLFLQINRNGVIHLPTINNGSGVYYVIIRYKSTINSLRSSFVLDTPFSSPTYSSSVDILSNCQSSCFAVVNRNFTLTSSTTWNIYLTFLSPSTNDAATIQIESVIFMPSEFYHATVLGMSSSSFLSKCNVVSNNFTGNDPTCVQGVFSLTMGLLGDAFGESVYFLSSSALSSHCIPDERA